MPVSPLHFQPLGRLARLRLAAEILAAYGRARWLLRSQEPAEAVASLRRYVRRHALPGEPGMELIVGRRLAHAVDVTLRPLPTDVRCLFRSLTLLTILERRALHPTLVIGVRSQPFEAHAWVELDGEPLLPVLEFADQRLVEL